MTSLYLFRRVFFILAIAALASLLTKSRALSERPIAARILNFGGGMHPEFTVKLGGDLRANILNEQTFQDMMETLGDDRRAVLMRDGGVLSVPSQQYWASFGFLDSSQNYIGPHVTTNGAGSFIFPCNILGDVIVGWSPNGGACSSDASRIRIGEAFNLINPFQVASSLLSYGRKQVNSSEGDGLSLNPGQQQTLIRTRKSTQFCEYWESSDGWNGWYCASTPALLEANNNRRPGSQITAREEVDSYSVDVFQGDILVQSEETPQAVRVLEGQRYTYPGGEINPIDVSLEANSCEVLKALNPYYAMSEETPDSLSIPITEQLQGHREALGVSGRPGNLSDLEQEVVDEMNLARTNPDAYIEFLAERRQYFRGNRLELPGETPLSTEEGVAAYDDAIAFLRSVRPRPVLADSSGMSQSAEDIVREQSAQGGEGHGNDLAGRLARYGSVGCSGGENISYGSSTAWDVVIQLIVDDGQFHRTHRENMFNPDFLVTGVACGTHPEWRAMCAITYANGYVEGAN